MVETKKDLVEHTKKPTTAPSLPVSPVTNAPGTLTNPQANANIPQTNNKGDLSSLISVGLIGALNTNGNSNPGGIATSLLVNGSPFEETNFNKRLLSRFGCYLIISSIKPNEQGDFVN